MRRGVALIELIFAMVIIALVLTAVPSLIGQTTKASKQAITQEAIGSAAAELDIIMSSFWDENTTDPQKNYPILTVAGPVVPSAANLALNEFVTNTGAGNNISQLRRVGSPLETPRKFSTDQNGNRWSATTFDNFGLDDDAPGVLEVTPDDIDDFNNTTLTLNYSGESAIASEGDYKDKKIQLKIEVGYVDETPTDTLGNAITFNNNVIYFNTNLMPIPASLINNRSTNIKEITLTLTSQNDPNKKIVLKGFSCNIGAGLLKERIF